MEQLEDNYLMNKVKAGDLDAMSLLFERHHRNLFGYFYRLTNRGEKSEDMVQMTFYRMLKYREAYRGEGKFIYWMYSIAKNIWLDTSRKKDIIDYGDRDRTVLNVPDQQKSGEELMIATERKQLLKLALKQLAPDKREAIVLSKFQGLKYQEIAALSNCTESTVKSRIRRGLLELRAIMNKLER